MAITRIKNSSIASKGPKYDNALAGLPYRPIIGTATDGGNGTTVSVAFTANNVAGAGVTYTALSSPGSLTATGPASPITVSGLTSGTAYTFQVKAGNSLGDSAYSASSNSVTPVQPTAFESIATATGTGSSGTITFSSIPSTFKHLQVRANVIPTSAGNSTNLRINNDTGGNYTRHRLYGTGTTVVADGAISQTQINLTGAGSGDTSYPTAIIIDILDYASTSKNKTVRIFSGIDKNGGADVSVNVQSGLWISTNAITQIDVISAANFGTASTFALYGIKEA